MLNDENMMSPLFPSDILSNEEMERGAKSISPEEMMILPPEEEGIAKRLYRAKDLKEIYGVSSVTISQYKDGQTIVRGDKTYVYEPLFVEGEDYILKEGKAFYTESACQKIKDSIGGKKRGRKRNSQQMTDEVSDQSSSEVSSKPKERSATAEIPKELVENGFISLNEICDKFGVHYVKLYNEFNKFKKGGAKGPDGNRIQITEGKDFVHHGKRVVLHETLVSEIMNGIQHSTRKPKTTKSHAIVSDEISLIYGSRIFKVTQEEAQRIIDVLSETSKKQMRIIQD